MFMFGDKKVIERRVNGLDSKRLKVGGPDVLFLIPVNRKHAKKDTRQLRDNDI